MSDLTPEEQAAADARRHAQVKRRELNERATKRLFMTDAECHLRAQNHTECSRAGIVNHREIRGHGDALVGHMKPILDEVHLTGPEVLELRRGMTRAGATPEEGAARRNQVIEGMRS